MRLFPWFREDLIKTPFFASNVVSQSISALAFIALCIYVWYSSLKKEKVD
jgi:hypothetical protein